MGDPNFQERGSLFSSREWVVNQTITERKVYTGIFASNRDEALERWKRGEGELNLDLTHRSYPEHDAVEVVMRDAPNEPYVCSECGQPHEGDMDASCSDCCWCDLVPADAFDRRDVGARGIENAWAEEAHDA